ncbi:MAG: carboxymuconolactone decarboxylase family protein, partial [Alphaproteobacteria bacterium]|nr:carboxymuconolactone decarboxylase family protein [Alphaproteobacteria bacterium]
MNEIAKLSLAKLTAETADPRAGAAMDGVRKSLGFVPNMYANMANSPSLLETYLSGYQAFRAEGGFAPAEQEVVFLTISRENGCEYCMAAHSMVGEKMSGVSAPVLKALRAGEKLPDSKLEALSEFTRIMVVNRGKPTSAELRAFLEAGFNEQQALAVILAI